MADSAGLKGDSFGEILEGRLVMPHLQVHPERRSRVSVPFFSLLCWEEELPQGTVAASPSVACRTGSRAMIFINFQRRS